MWFEGDGRRGVRGPDAASEIYDRRRDPAGPSAPQAARGLLRHGGEGGPARVGAYYAGPGNYFWPTLHAIGLTPRQLSPTEFPLLLEWGIGLTDACKTALGSDREIPLAVFDAPACGQP